MFNNALTLSLKDLQTKYNKKYEALDAMAKEQDLGKQFLQRPKDVVGNDKMEAMLAAATKLAQKISSSDKPLYHHLTVGSTAVKTATDLARGTLMSNLFTTGKSVGYAVKTIAQTVSGKLPKAASTSSILFKAAVDSFLIYDHVSTVANKTIKLPSKLLDIGISALIACNTGIIDSVLEAESKILDDKLEQAYNNSYLQQLKNVGSGIKSVVNSIYTDLTESYRFQKAKLDKLNNKITQEGVIETTLQEKPWKNPSELLTRKQMSTEHLNTKITTQVVDTVKASTKAVIGTILSTSFKCGKLIGSSFFRSTKAAIVENISPSITPAIGATKAGTRSK